MNSYFDFVYEHEQLLVIIDKNNKVWFAANDIAKILNYKAPRKIIEKYVPARHKKQYQELDIKTKVYNLKYQNKSVFIDEIGLFRLSIRSKQKKAIEFQEWITDKLLPELRQKGTFELKQKVTLLEKRIKNIRKVNERLLTERDYIRNIKMNPGKNVMYILKVKTSVRGRKRICYKLGITDNLKKRMTAYRTGNPNVKLINSFKLKNLKAAVVEKCVKSVLRYTELKVNNEIYCTSLANLYKMLQNCITEKEELKGICHGCNQVINVKSYGKHRFCNL